MAEPPRNASIDSLVPFVADRVEDILADMKADGYDAIVYEARRTQERQEWLYSIGRTRQKARKPVTWTLNSLHASGKAVDIISKKRGWDWPEFYLALGVIGLRHQMHQIRAEKCHLQWQG
jgi:hypothetical protein